MLMPEKAREKPLIIGRNCKNRGNDQFCEYSVGNANNHFLQLRARIYVSNRGSIHLSRLVSDRMRITGLPIHGKHRSWERGGFVGHGRIQMNFCHDNDDQTLEEWKLHFMSLHEPGKGFYFWFRKKHQSCQQSPAVPKSRSSWIKVPNKFIFFFRPNHPPTILISLTKTATQKASWASLKVNIQILHTEDMFEPNMFFERKWKTLGISHHISPLSTMRCFCLGAIWTKNHLHVIQIHPWPSFAISGGTGTMRNHEEPSGNVQKTSRWVEPG